MKLYEIAILCKDNEGTYSIISVPNAQILAKDESSARIEAARQIPADITSNQVTILVRAFIEGAKQ